MSTGTQIVLGLIIGVVLFLVLRRRLVGTTDATPHEPARSTPDEVDAETLRRVRDLLAEGKAMLAIKAVRDATGWDLLRSKQFVDRYR